MLIRDFQYIDNSLRKKDKDIIMSLRIKANLTFKTISKFESFIKHPQSLNERYLKLVHFLQIIFNILSEVL